jgi:hypothetical protein
MEPKDMQLRSLSKSALLNVFPIEKESCGVYSVCAVLRAHARLLKPMLVEARILCNSFVEIRDGWKILLFKLRE